MLNQAVPSRIIYYRRIRMIPHSFKALYGAAPPFEQPQDAFSLLYRACLGQLSITAKEGIPDFLIISPPKTGTTWLAKHLASHPQIFIPPEKEVRYFDLLWRFHDLNWYAGKFRSAFDRVKGDASPQFAWLPDVAIEQVRKLNPDLKLLFLPRRLPDRAWSHTRHCFRYRESTFRNCTGSFESAPQAELVKDFLSDLSLTASDYVGIIRRWMCYFPLSQFHVRYFEDALATPESYLRDVFGFLGVSTDVDLASSDLRESINAGLSAPLPEWAESILANIYAARQVEAEAFLAETFGQKSPWPPLGQIDLDPLWLFDWNSWRIYFYRGWFHAIQSDHAPMQPDELRETLDSQIGVDVFRGASTGELLCRLAHDQSPADACLVRVLLDIQNANYVQLVDSYHGFNLVRYRGIVYGIRQSLGPLNIRDEDLRQRYTSEDVIIGETIGEVQARIDAIEAQRVVAELTSRLNVLQFGPAGDASVIQLIGSYRDFNLVRHRGQAYGLRQSLGPVDLHRTDEDLLKQYSSSELIIGDSLGEIRARIDMILLLDAYLQTEKATQS